MRKALAGLLLCLGLASPALAQTKFTMPPPAGVTLGGLQVVTTCGTASGLVAGNTAFAAMDTTGVLCTSAGGGGGGGLSVVDQTAWVQGTSAFTPSGGVFNDTATLSSGQEGTARLTTKRAQIVDIDSTGNQLHTDLTSPIPAGTNVIGGVTQSGTWTVQPGNTANTTAWKVDGSAVTQPVSVASLPALPANQSVNLAQVAGATTAVGSGVQATALRTTLATDSPGLITLGPATVANSVPFTFSSQYPTNATTTTPTAVTASATGTTAATAASLGATASVTNFVCGFDITADATALATGTAVLSGTISGSLSYLYTVTAVTSGTSTLSRTFTPCIPASATNTAITITSAAAGTGGNTIVNIFGYRL